MFVYGSAGIKQKVGFSLAECRSAGAQLSVGVMLKHQGKWSREIICVMCTHADTASVFKCIPI